MAGMLEKLWDDVVGGSAPDKGLKQLRKNNSENGRDAMHDPRVLERRFSAGAYGSPSQNISIKKPQKITTLDTDSVAGTPSSLGSTPPASPSMASPSSYHKEKDNIWRSVFHPGQNTVMRKVGSDKFDKAQPNSPTVYDWLYSANTKSEYR
jgi:hypothetical protein